MGEQCLYEIFLSATTVILYAFLALSTIMFISTQITSAEPGGTETPEILEISINNFSTNTTLNPNQTKTIYCTAVIKDLDNQTNLNNVTATFYNEADSSPVGPEDNNKNYQNDSCEITKDFGTWASHTDDEFQILANCTFQVEYYANPGDWSCYINATDDDDMSNQSEQTLEILELLAIGLPDAIDYGIVGPRTVSGEKIITIENLGNIGIDIQISSYAKTKGDNLSMDCPQGPTKNISLIYERYNTTTPNPGNPTLSEFNAEYKNVNGSATLEQINLTHRQDDAENEATDQTYWRIYVPKGVSGTCQGNIDISAIPS